MKRDDIPFHRNVQTKAKAVLAQIAHIAAPGMSEADIAALCVELLEGQGITETWYYHVPAFVLAQDRTVLSLSGRDYEPFTELRLSEGDLLTVDLSPLLDGRWGDCARSFCVGENVPSAPIQAGLETELQLHRELVAWATPKTTFAQLFDHMNARIRALG